MHKLLKKPNGPFRVLHSAAANKEFRKVYRYLRDRTRHMRYAEFRAQGLPIGSGITEAACKTVFTQRLKLSGMRWSNEGARAILNLRVILLSGVWDEVYRDLVNSYYLTPAG